MVNSIINHTSGHQACKSQYAYTSCSAGVTSIYFDEDVADHMGGETSLVAGSDKGYEDAPPSPILPPLSRSQIGEINADDDVLMRDFATFTQPRHDEEYHLACCHSFDCDDDNVHAWLASPRVRPWFPASPAATRSCAASPAQRSRAGCGWRAPITPVGGGTLASNFLRFGEDDQPNSGGGGGGGGVIVGGGAGGYSSFFAVSPLSPPGRASGAAAGRCGGGADAGASTPRPPRCSPRWVSPASPQRAVGIGGGCGGGWYGGRPQETSCRPAAAVAAAAATAAAAAAAASPGRSSRLVVTRRDPYLPLRLAGNRPWVDLALPYHAPPRRRGRVLPLLRAPFPPPPQSNSPPFVRIHFTLSQFFWGVCARTLRPRNFLLPLPARDRLVEIPAPRRRLGGAGGVMHAAAAAARHLLATDGGGETAGADLERL
jgi:hypothetical protein